MTTRLTEIGRRNSEIDLSRIQEIHDAAAALGASCGAAETIKIDPKKARRVLRYIEAQNDNDRLRAIAAKSKQEIERIWEQAKKLSDEQKKLAGEEVAETEFFR